MKDWIDYERARMLREIEEVNVIDFSTQRSKAHRLPPIAAQAEINAEQMRIDRNRDAFRLLARVSALAVAAVIVAVVAISAFEAPAKLRANLAIIEASR